MAYQEPIVVNVRLTLAINFGQRLERLRILCLDPGKQCSGHGFVLQPIGVDSFGISHHYPALRIVEKLYIAKRLHLGINIDSTIRILFPPNIYRSHTCMLDKTGHQYRALRYIALLSNVF